MRYLYGKISIGAAHDDDMTLPCPATSLAGAIDEYSCGEQGKEAVGIDL